jgi:hypothetical protein
MIRKTSFCNFCSLLWLFFFLTHNASYVLHRPGLSSFSKEKNVLHSCADSWVMEIFQGVVAGRAFVALVAGPGGWLVRACVSILLKGCIHVCF